MFPCSGCCYWSPIVELNEPLVVLPARRLLPQEIAVPERPCPTPVTFLTISVLDARSVPLANRPKLLWLATQPSRVRSPAISAKKPTLPLPVATLFWTATSDWCQASTPLKSSSNRE